VKVAGVISMGLDVIIGMELRMKARHARKNVQAIELCVWWQIYSYITNSRDLETKMNGFNEVSCTIRRTLTNKTRKVHR
jgi:hypothetical protein